MKKNFSLLICLLMVLSMFSTTAFATSASYQVEVLDYGNLLTAEEEAYLLQAGRNHANVMNMDIVYLTATDTNGKDTMTYSDDIFDELIDAPGSRYSGDGIMFVIDLDPDNYMNYVNTIGSALAEINDYEIERILDAAAEAADDDYVGCMENMGNRAEYVYQTHTTPNSTSHNPRFYLFNSSSIMTGIFIAIISCVGLVGKHNAANKKTNAAQYLENGGSITVNAKDTRFVRTYQKTHKNYYKPKESSSSSRGGSSHRSSSGRSHGGGGRRR